jgi:dTDP-glucose 4,6-dehydratase
MRKLLVTGGAGFIGANFVHYWIQQHPDDVVVVLDALTYAGNRENLAPVSSAANFHFVHGDICDCELVEKLLREYSLDTIVHFAAESHVDRSITGPDAFIETNIIGTHSLLKAARKVWLQGAAPIEHRFHHVSTDEVYGELNFDDPAFTEDTPYAPNSPYSASKAASDHLVRAYHHTYGLNVTTSNCSNNYGAYHYPEKLIPLMITNLLTGKDIPVYGKGENIRDWLHVDDHARGIELILDGGQLGETYNIGGHNELTNMQVVEAVCLEIDNQFASRPELASNYPLSNIDANHSAMDRIRYVSDRAGHDLRYAIDPQKIEAIGYSAKTSVQDGMKQTISWYLDNPAWWTAIQATAAAKKI